MVAMASVVAWQVGPVGICVLQRRNLVEGKGKTHIETEYAPTSTACLKLRYERNGPMNTSKHLLVLAAILSFCVAIFQAIVSLSPSWSLYFGAPAEMVSKPLLLLVIGEACAVVFAVFGLYALSGAGYIRFLPLLRWGLLGIGVLFTFRGLLVIPILLSNAGLFQLPESTEPTALESSLISLGIGVIYLLGTVMGWKQMKRTSRAEHLHY